MKRYRVYMSPEAKADLGDLQDAMAMSTSPKSAVAYREEIIRECMDLAVAPIRGQHYGDPSTRSISFRKQVTIIFRIDEQAGIVDIGRILRRGQELGPSLDALESR